jgi:DHA2 family multidrug resistance protein
MEQTEKKSNLKWWILATVIVGTFLGRLDQTIVNLALPKIISDFGITVSSAGWIATAYIIANAVFVPIWGKLGDSIGRKKVYILGFSGFIIGSVLAGLSWNLGSMIVFRVIQAIAGSADYPTAMAILAVTFKNGKERAQALGIWSSAFAASAVLGPLIGGPLIDHFNWRTIFLINLPVGIVGLIMALIFIDESVSESKDFKFDWWGAITLGAGITAVVLVLDKGSDWGFLSSNAWWSYFAAIASFIIFVLIEKHVEQPMLDLKFFKNTIFLHTLLNNFIVFMGLMGSMFIMPLFAQNFLGYDATETGYLFIPMAFALMLGAPLGGRLTDVVKPSYVIAASTFVAGVGIFMFSFLDAKSVPLDFMLPLVIMAFGMGFGMAQRTSLVASAVPQSEIGSASSVLALIRNVAGAFGIAIFSTILNSTIESKVLSISQNSTLRSTNPTDMQIFTQLIIAKAQVVGYDTIFVYASIILFVGSVLILFIKDVKMVKGVEVHVE